MRSLRALKYAKQISRRSNHQHRIGAVICQGAIIKSRGYNQVRLSRIGRSFSNYPESLHAERHACTQLDREDIRGCSIYIWRETRDGRPANARPCEDCQRLLQELGIRKIIYTIGEKPYYQIERVI